MTDTVEAVQTALYSTLSSALSVPVYDDPEGATYPYVTIDAVEVRDEDFLVDRMDRHFAYLTVWSNYAGKKEVIGINSEIYDALHHKTLTLSTGHVANMRVLRRDVDRDVDELTYMGSVTVEMLIQH